jgi:magnesium chelatase family protein
MVSRYQKRISGPLLDRIDIHVEVPRVDYEKLSSDSRDFAGCGGAERRRAQARRSRPRAAAPSLRGYALKLQRRQCAASPSRGWARPRFASLCPLGILPGRRDREESAQGGHTCTWTAGASVQQMHLSARAYHRELKLGRTIADLAGSEHIQTAHIAEAIQYRPRRQV